jgi:hypothetical protein
MPVAAAKSWASEVGSKEEARLWRGRRARQERVKRRKHFMSTATDGA